MDKKKVLEVFEAAWEACDKDINRFINGLQMFELNMLEQSCKGRKMKNLSDDESKYRFFDDWSYDMTTAHDVRMTDGKRVWMYDKLGQLVKEDATYMLPTEILWLAQDVTRDSWEEQPETNED